MDVPVTKTGLRIHNILKDGFDEVVVGQTYTALCGVVWEPTITDPEQLAEIPFCYDCLSIRAVDHLAHFDAISSVLRDYDRENNDNDT
jgi:hypothetical protein